MFTFYSTLKLIVLSSLLLCGCTAPQMTLVNNTLCSLNVTAGNKVLSTNLASGATLTIPSKWWQYRIGVVVAGYNDQNQYTGANDWTFYCGQDQVWRVDRLQKPQ